ncbi:nucleoside-diphosphate sugar epimerase/dehydratase [Robbsia sp. Bb-Pol-6]|uniref:Nucleoside-diphosphate sugar epimerase/dehydratase n=1 Tax=Robbsia betulipollinis TaxID=2981849 RepID=A0ABT3ZMT8_9BURK|nr:nucleoside-diphosphate sugar epimerase/dehydratase [Robbsia betulipollinis]MCY0387570.1 nucleoside-diphosphate sugar epimerase/dehydratase [Robbsia betulipollinis]
MSEEKVRWRSTAAFVFDLCAIFLAWMTAYLLRFNGTLPHAYTVSAWRQLVWVLPIYAVMFRVFGLYRGIWLFASLPDLMRIGKAVSMGALLVIIGSVLIQPLPLVPRSVLIVTPVLLLLLMGGVRALYRVGKESYNSRKGQEKGPNGKGKPVLILGAGRAGALLARELSHSHEWRLLGLLDDSPTRIGRDIYGYRVLGSIDDLEKWTGPGKAGHVIIAMPGADAQVKRRVATLCMRVDVRVMMLPELADVASSENFLSRVRSIDLEDLLGRDPVRIDTEHVGALLRDRVVMVSGAGGSIGSELCRQIAQFQPALLVAYDFSEFSIYKLGEEFRDKFGELPLVEIVGDVKDVLLLTKVMQTYNPYIVFHAAAYKHVPLMEDVNTWQAVRNNVLGTYRIGRAAISANVRHFVLISTDKAVNPTNVMGGSKRLAEMMCEALQQTTRHTQFEIVRFGNVLGSAGSVIPKFQEQIARGGPVTVTHPDITRFFMTIPEASQLVLQASSMGRGGEIFVLDMGKPMRIVDLARDLIRLYGFMDDQIEIQYTGLRPGEKLYEELLACDEETRPTRHPKLLIARTRDVPATLVEEVLAWLTQERVPEDEEVRSGLLRWVPEYMPPDAGAPVPPAPASALASGSALPGRP